jgi:hypothetical protein
MDLHCKKCLTSRTGDVLGAPCATPGCDGVIEAIPSFDTLVDRLPEPMTCRRRAETGMDNPSSPFKGAGPGLDRWLKFKAPHGNRVCSYCGSIHFEDLVVLVRACADAPAEAEYGTVPEIEPSDKSYKVYVHQPGVRNAMEGGIKFYMQHVPRDTEDNIDVTLQLQDEYKRAVLATKRRFERYLAGMRRTA